VHPLLAQGDVRDAVQHHVEAPDAGLVVMGTRGSGFMRRLEPGTTAELFHAFEVPFEDKLRFAGVDDSLIERYRVQARAVATQRLHELAHAAGL